MSASTQSPSPGALPARACVGIDLGWSDYAETCSVAVRVRRDKGYRRRGWTGYGGGVIARNFTLSELLRRLRRPSTRAALRTAVLVIDAPLSAAGTIATPRYVDGACSANGFHGRVAPQAVTTGVGRLLTEVGLQVTAAAGGSDREVALRVDEVRSGRVFVETNPTVALAVLVPMQKKETLPTKSDPKVDPRGRRVRKRSDWYWMLGANLVVATSLGAPQVAHEHDHELKDALLCLAIAEGLTAAPVGSATIGRVDGVYALLGRADPTWRTDLERVGILSGRISYVGLAGTPGPPSDTPATQPPDALMMAAKSGKGTSARSSRTTTPGYVNRNGQEVVRRTHSPGTDHGQRVYVLRCRGCDLSYGANGSDIFQRRCPSCQRGAPGLPYE